MTIGIYLLYFDEIDSVYVGQSTNILKRYRDHKSVLRLQKHTNYKLQQAYNLYGFPKLQILENCDISALDKLEIAWTKEFDSLNNGLNVSFPGKGAGSGINNHNSKYTKLQLLRVFRACYLDSSITDKQISEKYFVNESTVTSIRLGNSHLWLKNDYPKQYSWIKAKDKKYTGHINRPNPFNNMYEEVSLRDPYGNIHIFVSIRKFAKENKLDSSNISKVLKGIYKSTKGWTKP